MIISDKNYIAKKIKEYRKKSGLTQAELAEKIDIGTKQISRIEVAEFYPSLSTFFKIVDVLNIDINDFVVSSVKDNNHKVRKRLLDVIYNASDEELEFYDRLVTFANDEVTEIKKNILLKKIY